MSAPVAPFSGSVGIPSGPRWEPSVSKWKFLGAGIPLKAFFSLASGLHIAEQSLFVCGITKLDSNIRKSLNWAAAIAHSYNVAKASNTNLVRPDSRAHALHILNTSLGSFNVCSGNSLLTYYVNHKDFESALQELTQPVTRVSTAPDA